MTSIILTLFLVLAFNNEICFGYQIFVKQLTGKIITVNVESSDRIMDVKIQIDDQEKISPDLQILVYKGQQLQDGHQLAYYNIGRECSIYLILKSRQKVRAPPNGGEFQK